MKTDAAKTLIKRSALSLPAAIALMLLSSMMCRSQGVITTRLATDGVVLQSVVVSPAASPQVRASAAELAEMLTRITAAPFKVIEGDGSHGIVVGVYTNFTAHINQPDFAPEMPTRREEYIIRSHPEGLWLIGATDIAVEQAIWGLLDHLGYRLFFLTDTWEVVPSLPSLDVALDLFEAPDYISRLAPRGAPWSDQALWERWRKRNRVNSAFAPSTGHAYEAIIRDNRAVFAAHPEYYALVNGERKPSEKFCTANSDLFQLVIEQAVHRISNNPTMESISMDPSDGGGWCECSACLEMGSVSDRALILANEVAKAINKLDLGPRYVGIYAYNQHSPPPSLPVHSNVVVSVATSFIRGGYTVEELIEGWRAKGATLGIRDYHDVFTWSHDMPRRAIGGDLNYLQRTIPYFFAQGARYMNSENSDSWGANGLGYWITPRILWRVAEAQNLDALVADFIGKAFGPAREPMQAFYTLLNLDRELHTAEHITAIMYRHLAEARRLATAHPKVMARLDDLVLYTRYVELYNGYREAAGGARQAAFESLWRHAFRMRDRMMLSTVAICDRERYRDSSVSLPEGAEWKSPAADHPWKESRPFSSEEIEATMKAGIAANQPVVLTFKPIAFSAELLPATRLALPANLPVAQMPLTGRSTRTFLTWLEQPGSIPLEITGGQIEHYRNRGNVKVNLFAAEEATLKAVARNESTPPDGKSYPVALNSPYRGVHTLEISDGNDSTRLGFPTNLALTVHSSMSESARLYGRWSLYFYVPRSTRVVGGFTDNRTGRMCDATGKAVFDFTAMERDGYFNVPVEEGQDGTFWRMENCAGDRPLLTVPSYFADHPTRLLLPREVVERDLRLSRGQPIGVRIGIGSD